MAYGLAYLTKAPHDDRVVRRILRVNDFLYHIVGDVDVITEGHILVALFLVRFLQYLGEPDLGREQAVLLVGALDEANVVLRIRIEPLELDDAVIIRAASLDLEVAAFSSDHALDRGVPGCSGQLPIRRLDKPRIRCETLWGLHDQRLIIGQPAFEILYVLGG